MAPVWSRRRFFLVIEVGFCLALILGLTACSSAPPTIQPTSTLRSEIVRFQSPTPSPLLPTLKPRTTDQPTPQPPTPTPFTYNVVKGDTMLGIALRYGISLEDLLAANPEVDPRLLSVDTDLVIPLGETSPSALATPTPIPVIMSEPTCYRTLDLGAWCFLLVKNILDEPLENVSARIYLVPRSEGDAIDKTAFTPLNLIPAGKAMPVMVFFDPPLDQDFIPGAELISALPANQADERYIPAKAKINKIIIEQTGLAATLEGIISTPKKSKPAGLIRLVAVAFGQDERVVGIRQLEIVDPVEPGADYPFSLEVFSLGPPVGRVEVFVEAIPESDNGKEMPTGN
jgi:LysM repeat protein